MLARRLLFCSTETIKTVLMKKVTRKRKGQVILTRVNYIKHTKSMAGCSHRDHGIHIGRACSSARTRKKSILFNVGLTSTE